MQLETETKTSEIHFLMVCLIMVKDLGLVHCRVCLALSGKRQHVRKDLASWYVLLAFGVKQSCKCTLDQPLTEQWPCDIVTL